MFHTHSHAKQYAVAAIVGAVGGKLAIALARKAAPKVRSGLMHRMMAGMQKKGFSPADM